VVPDTAQNCTMASYFKDVIHGDDFASSVASAEALKSYERNLVSSFEEHLFKLKECNVVCNQSFTFIGWKFFFDRGVKIRMAFPERTVVRLQFPLANMEFGNFEQCLKNYTCLFVNNGTMYDGLIKLCSKYSIEPFEKSRALAVVNGQESASHKEAITVRYNDGEYVFESSKKAEGSLRSDAGRTQTSSLNPAVTKSSSASVERGDNTPTRVDGGGSRRGRRRRNYRQNKARKREQEKQIREGAEEFKSRPHQVAKSTSNAKEKGKEEDVGRTQADGVRKRTEAAASAKGPE